ncbi:hypothetical protein ACWCSV_34425, partial [Streptomyces sp. NPDC001770]
GLSSSRQGNAYRWDGNGSTYVSGPLPLEAAEDVGTLTASRELVAGEEERRARNVASGSGQPPGAGKRSKKAKTVGGNAGDGGQQGAGVRGAPPASGGARGRRPAATGSRTQPEARRLGTAEARRLARAVLDAEVAAGQAGGDYTRREENEQRLVEGVTARLVEYIPQAQARNPFEPTVELARMFSDVDMDLSGGVQLDVLPYLAADPDLLVTISESRNVRFAVLTQPGFAEFLRAHPQLLRALATTTISSPVAPQAPFLMKYTDVAKDMEDNADLRERIVPWINVIEALGGKLGLLRAVADDERLTLAVAEVPQLAEALRTSSTRMAAVRTLSANLNLIQAIRGYPDTVPDAGQFKALLGNASLVQAMNRHPQQLLTVFRVPELLAAAGKDPAVLGVLDHDPALSDVLVEIPELARRLAQSPVLLRVAFANRGLAGALSYNPRLLDMSSGDSELAQHLRAATAPQNTPRDPGPQARPAQRLLADPRVRAAVDGHRELGTTLLSDSALVAVLADHPGLLDAPHEYRRLLAPANASLREQLRPGSPLLSPGLLRALLRYPQVSHGVGFWYLQAGTATAPPEDRRRLLAEALARNPGMQAAIWADFALGDLMFTVAQNGDRHGKVTGFNDALRGDGRLVSLIARNAFIVALLEAGALPALLANDSALLQLALAARDVTGTLHMSPERRAHAVEHPDLLRTLAAYENKVTPSAHWARLFEDPALLAALDSADGLMVAKALASNPDLLTDALARDGFIGSMKEPGRPAEYVELNRRSSKVFAEAVRASGEASITRSGIRIAGGPARIARAVLDAPDRIAEAIEQAPAEHREHYRVTAEAAVRALRVRPELRRAIDREFGIALAMLANGEMTATLLKRPALIGYLADRGKGALKAVYDRPELTRALRDNGRLYLGFVSDPYLVQTLVGFDQFADAMGRNREYVRVWDLAMPHELEQEHALFQASEVVSAAVADSTQVMMALAANPTLVRMLTSPYYASEGQRLHTGRAREAAESIARAAVSNMTVLRALIERPRLFAVLVAGPVFSRVLAENPGAVATEADVVALLENVRLVAVLNGYPEQAGMVLRTAGLLPVVMRAPGLVAAMARSEHLTGLLGREDVRALLRERPEVADDLMRVPELVDALGGLPGLVAAMRAKSAPARLLRGNPGLLAVLRARRTLVGDLARDTALWQALTRVPALPEALSQSARVLRHLRRRSGLLGVLASDSTWVALSGPQLLAVLSDDALTALLDVQPRLAGLVLGSPEVAGRALEDAGFTDGVRSLARDKGRFEDLLRDPDRFLAELARLAATPQPEARRRQPAAAASRQETPSGAAGSSAVRVVPDAELVAVVRRMPELAALRR